ncbi:MAG: ribonuclease HIII [Chlamydiales bacterium]|nr:ribonuclease HIII [Chlamydiales bacterium]
MTYVLQFNLELSEKLRLGLQSQGFTLTTPPHTLFQGKKKGLSCTLYTSGKLVVQGREMKEFIEFYLEPEILGSFEYGYAAPDQDFFPHIGVDESGKGDFFGPLCVAGVFADGEGISKLEKLGVKDSKRLKDEQILKLAEKIRRQYPFHLVRIGPKRYNELYEKFGNLNLLLGWGHAAVIESMLEKTGCNRVVIDQFAAEHVVETALSRKGKNVHLIQRTQGERDLVVAAASILARASFVEGLSQLEKEVNQKLPKGASNLTIESGKKLVAKHGTQILSQVSKLHFNTTSKIL